MVWDRRPIFRSSDSLLSAPLQAPKGGALPHDWSEGASRAVRGEKSRRLFSPSNVDLSHLISSSESCHSAQWQGPLALSSQLIKHELSIRKYICKGARHELRSHHDPRAFASLSEERRKWQLLTTWTTGPQSLKPQSRSSKVKI